MDDTNVPQTAEVRPNVVPRTEVEVEGDQPIEGR
jgi:hypothetical protein